MYETWPTTDAGRRRLFEGVTYMTESRCQGPPKNHLLGALPASDYNRIAPQLELVHLGLGDVL
jgi:hypothetical protein